MLLFSLDLYSCTSRRRGVGAFGAWTLTLAHAMIRRRWAKRVGRCGFARALKKNRRAATAAGSGEGNLCICRLSMQLLVACRGPPHPVIAIRIGHMLFESSVTPLAAHAERRIFRGHRRAPELSKTCPKVSPELPKS